MNEDVRLVVKLASECIDFEETILSKYAYSNVIRPPVNCHSFFLLFFFLFPSSSILLLALFFPFFLFFLSLRCILQFISLSLSCLSFLFFLLFLYSYFACKSYATRRTPSTKVYGRANSSRCGGAKWNKSPGSPRIGEETRLLFFLFFLRLRIGRNRKQYLDPNRTTSCRNFGRPATRSPRSTTH